jgi:hypothetical protein
VSDAIISDAQFDKALPPLDSALGQPLPPIENIDAMPAMPRLMPAFASERAGATSLQTAQLWSLMIISEQRTDFGMRTSRLECHFVGPARRGVAGQEPPHLSPFIVGGIRTAW